jgi:hypothetical protein
MIVQADSLIGNVWEHVSIFATGAAALGIVAHAVNTFPTPKSDLGKWILGTVQYIVGQRLQAVQTKQDTKSIAAAGNQ